MPATFSWPNVLSYDNRFLHFFFGFPPAFAGCSSWITVSLNKSVVKENAIPVLAGMAFSSPAKKVTI